ncbi:MAG: hypothetical protein DBY38_02420 [Clostridium cadaveris]|uniref:Chitin-binding type-3 domain-containing protein n=1 Tax=Clostridium cadaveris TaxID=1529 RepID=A0A316MDF8_9CLOT|nr:MAG: hypothetical protein DBY38_02420 [Clostridium cadaveris]
MYSIIKEVLIKGKYELVDVLSKINKLWIEGSLTEEERDELVNLARSNANSENSYAENTQQIANLWEYYQQLDSRLTKLENNQGVELPLEEEWVEFVRPTGSHDAYKIGDKVIFNNKKYICQMDNCVWNPLVYPSAWELVEE